MDSVKITLFGIGCHIVQGRFEADMWQQLNDAANRCNSLLQEAFFDPNFYEQLKSKKYNSWLDLGNRANIHGLINAYPSTIEIKVNNKQKRKIVPNDLLHENVLFPIYDTENVRIEISDEKQSLSIVEKEIGTIANYKFETDKFSFEKLKFTLQTIRIREDITYTLLTEIKYNGQELRSKISDTLVKERFAICVL